MKVVILDRDGVINYNTSTRIITPEQWKPIPSSIEAIVKLKKAGYIVVLATNQSIVAKQMITIDGLQAIHNKMQQALKIYDVTIDKIFFCPHKDSDQCLCRKPKPGMLLDIAKEFNLDFKQQRIPFVGDDTIDVLAANAAGAVPILVKTGKGLQTMASKDIADIKDLLVFDDLLNFVNYWYGKRSGG